MSRGYNKPGVKLKYTAGDQRSQAVGTSLGLAGGHPTAGLTYNYGKSKSSTTEVADDAVRLKEQVLVLGINAESSRRLRPAGLCLVIIKTIISTATHCVTVP